jgi:hypothetical protein
MTVLAISHRDYFSELAARRPSERTAPAAAPAARARRLPEPPLRIGAGIAEQKLAAVDAEVRAHEAAHLAAAGTAAGGGASFDYVIGPNGERYAVGGSVRVVATPVFADPEATIRKAKALIQAAYAVSLPSAADMRVAAEAYQMEMDAKRELAQRAEAGAHGLASEAAAGLERGKNRWTGEIARREAAVEIWAWPPSREWLA